MNAHTTPSQAPTSRRRTALAAAACCAVLMGTLPPPAAARGRDAGLQPTFEGAVPAKVRFVLSSAYPIALGRLERVESCAGLFAALGADGREQLSAAVFHLASSEQEEGVCRRRMGDAFTEIGGTRIGLCGRFAGLTRWEAAVRLIHEALHHAGMSEKPVDPDALTSREINQLVKVRCEL